MFELPNHASLKKSIIDEVAFSESMLSCMCRSLGNGAGNQSGID
jgi:hypothetical protein